MQIEEHALAGPIVRLVHGTDEALVALRGGHVVAWRHGGRDMLWCTATRLEGKPLRGGIPVCWPWFGPHPTDATKPMHGIARTSPWELVEHGADVVALTLRHGNLHAHLDVVLGDTLRVSLTTHNEAAEPAAVSAALHTYLAVDDIAQVRVSGLDGASYFDKVDEGSRKLQRGDLTFERETDRIYAADRAILHDGPRRIEVDGAGTSHTLVAWNPWVEKSARLGDMAPGDYRHMVCLETAWAADDTRTLSPGSAATLTTVLRPTSTSP